MEDREPVAIGTVVMRNKQYLAAIRPLDGALAMSTMRFADEVVPRVGHRRGADTPVQAGRQGAASWPRRSSTRWRPTGSPSSTTTPTPRSCAARIEAKDKGKEIVEAEPEKPEGAEILDLMAALEASVDAAKGRGGASLDAGRRASAPPRPPEDREINDLSVEIASQRSIPTDRTLFAGAQARLAANQSSIAWYACAAASAS